MAASDSRAETDVSLPTEGARRRIILLGASNLTISFPLVLRLMQSGSAVDTDVYAAMGHGRSFGMWSRIFHRSLPGIVQCRLWDDLQARSPAAENLALITDIGNDLMYGASVDQISGWVEACLQRLQAHQARVAMTLLPMSSIRRLGAVHYTCARTMLFPRCRICFSDMSERVNQLDERIRELALRYEARVVEPPLDWYGFDPIHIRSVHRQSAWRQILSAWQAFDANPSPGRLALRTTYRVKLLRPAVRRVFGREQVTPQPALQLDRLSVALY